MTEIMIRTDFDGFRFAYARDLYTMLGITESFSWWMSRIIRDFELDEKRQEYMPITIKTGVGRPRMDCILPEFVVKRILTAYNRDIQKHLIHISDAWNNPYAILIRASQVHRGYKQL
jgi:hypothetical protein